MKILIITLLTTISVASLLVVRNIFFDLFADYKIKKHLKQNYT